MINVGNNAKISDVLHSVSFLSLSRKYTYLYTAFLLSVQI